LANIWKNGKDLTKKYCSIFKLKHFVHCCTNITKFFEKYSKKNWPYIFEWFTKILYFENRFLCASAALISSLWSSPRKSRSHFVNPIAKWLAQKSLYNPSLNFYFSSLIFFHIFVIFFVIFLRRPVKLYYTYAKHVPHHIAWKFLKNEYDDKILLLQFICYIYIYIAILVGH